MHHISKWSLFELGQITIHRNSRSLFLGSQKIGSFVELPPERLPILISEEGEEYHRRIRVYHDLDFS